MRRYILLAFAAVLSAALLAGCKVVETKILVSDEKWNENSFSKAQKIVVFDAAGNEKAVLTEQSDINAFVDTVCVDGWKLKEMPEGVSEAGSFTLWQSETITALFGEHEAKASQICTCRVYAGDEGDFLMMETGFVDIPFSVPPGTADYLRELAA